MANHPERPATAEFRRGASLRAEGPEEFARAVALGLSDAPRWIPVRFLYDARGSELFDEITTLPEYYLTRTEAEILEAHAADITATTGPVTLIELGAGSAVKTSRILDAYMAAGDGVTYVPVDVSEAALRGAAERIAARHPGVAFRGVVGTYDDAFPLVVEHEPAMVMFLGSTIGNFAHAESYAFWQALSRGTPAGSYFLVGVDLVKDPAVLEAAYNDAAGVTARFTKNLFERMNRELDAGLDLSAIEHEARYNPEWQRIEIFARFTKAQSLHLAPLDRVLDVEAGARILTEISRKFVLGHVEEFVRCFDFRVLKTFTDEKDWFAVLLLERR